MSNHLLLALQFHEGDKKQAMDLSRLMVDTIGHKTDLADILFFARYDCAVDNDAVIHAETAFKKVHVAQSKRRMTGWPIGPNAMAMDLFALVHSKHVKKEWDYSGVMMIEADCIPLRSTWLTELYAEWHAGQQMIMGAWIGSKRDPIKSHINGNLIFSPRITHVVPALLSSTTPTLAWDVRFWKNWMHVAKPSRLIYSDYKVDFTDCDVLWAPRTYTAADSPLADQTLSPCWLHGCKDLRALECARERLL